MAERYDVAVIGSGPGGEGAAMQAAKLGLRTVVIERHREVGGGCTHWGTIPSKALRHQVEQIQAARRHPLLGEAVRERRVELPEVLRLAASTVRQQVEMRRGFYERNRVEVVHGRARFADPHTVEALLPDGAVRRIAADHFVIATGSRPYHPPDVDFSHPAVLDADTVLELDHTPRSIVIYGAGVIGCEYASILRGLGIKVNLINTRSRLLDFLDDEIVDAVTYHLREQGVVVRHGERYTSCEPLRDGRVALHLESGKSIRAEALLWANGRTGNTADLALERAGLTADERGNLEVDSCYRTAVPHIYAVGDVIGPPALASAAYDQGRYAARHIADPSCEHRLAALIPTGIYTSPEVSCVGHTERDLTRAKVPYEVGRSPFRSLARAQIAQSTVGMLKILFHRETLEVLGVHCFGYQAAEIVHIGQAVMAQGPPHNRITYFAEATFNYPTMAEAYRVAALNGLNRLR